MASEEHRLDELELIRIEAIRFLEQERPFKWAVHVDELKRDAIMLVDGLYRIGIWVFDFETLTLLREPDIAPEVVIYGLVFQRDPISGYRVVQDLWGHESYDFGD